MLAFLVCGWRASLGMCDDERLVSSRTRCSVLGGLTRHPQNTAHAPDLGRASCQHTACSVARVHGPVHLRWAVGSGDSGCIDARTPKI